ncbi:MAG TPA: hypothetical protein VGK19_23200 [Capsulimonadaceae bacterium]
MENETHHEQPPTVTSAQRNTARRWIAFVVACAASGALVFVSVPYLSGWGFDPERLAVVGGIYVGVLLPVVGYICLRPARGRALWRQALGFAGVVLVCYVASIVGGFGGLFAAGAPIDLPYVGMSDRVRYTNVGPVLVSWAKREIAAHPSPPSKSAKPVDAMGGEYPLRPTGMPQAARWLCRDRSSVFIDRDERQKAIGVVICVSYDTTVEVYPNPKLEPIDAPLEEEDRPTLHPYPGITVKHYVR